MRTRVEQVSLLAKDIFLGKLQTKKTNFFSTTKKEEEQFNELETKLSNLSDRWSNVCKFVGNRWFIVQDLLNKLQAIDKDFNDISLWIQQQSAKLKELINTIDNSNQSDINLVDLIQILKDIERDMQTMHKKLNDMNDLGQSCHPSSLRPNSKIHKRQQKVSIPFLMLRENQQNSLY
jgi:hypothetical protein